MTVRTVSSHPDMILHNGSIYTVDSAAPWAEAIAIRDGIITAIGESTEVAELAGPDTTVINLEGRLVLPGLCDAHIHFYDWSLAQAEVLLYDTSSKDEMLDRIGARSQTSPPDAWITGRGWNESWWGDTQYPTATDLDAVTGPTQPAIFWRTDMHAAVANSRAIMLAGIDRGTANPPGGVIERDDAGMPTGVLKELAIALVADLVPHATQVEGEDAIRNGIRALHRMGVTAIHDQRMKGHDDGIRALAAYQSLHHAEELRLRINCNLAAHQLPAIQALGLSSGFGDDRLRLGHIKVFADGSLGSQTALMLQPFDNAGSAGTDNSGVRLTELDDMSVDFRLAAELGFPISVHAIGDRANRDVLDLFEELLDAVPRPRAPHRIEHAQILHPDDLPRLAELGITASVQPVHIIDDIEIADRVLGKRGERLYSFRSLLATGALVSFGSDAPVANASPFLGIHAALFRQKPERVDAAPWFGSECISLEQAIHAYTLGAAQAAGWQNEIGSIELGKRADLVALDRDLFEIVESSRSTEDVGTQIADTQVDLTIFDGEIVYDQR